MPDHALQEDARYAERRRRARDFNQELMKRMILEDSCVDCGNRLRQSDRLELCKECRNQYLG